MKQLVRKLFLKIKTKVVDPDQEWVVRSTTNSNEVSVLSKNALQLAHSDSKPTILIFSIDRAFIDCYITKTYNALTRSGVSKEWALNKTLEWKKMGHPRKVIPDILKYVNIQLQPSEPFRYFAK